MNYTAIAKIEKLIPGGKGLCRVDGKVVFVPFVLPGEKVEIRIREEKKSYCEAELLSVLESSPERIQPICPLYGICGGCNMQHMTYDRQLEAKIGFLKEHLLRNANISLDDIPVVSSKPFAYRNRVQVHFGNGVAGFKEKSGDRVIGVDKCPVASEGINQYFRDISSPESEGRYTVYGTDQWYSKEGTSGDISVDVLGQTIHFNSSLFFQSNLSILTPLGEYLRKNIQGGSLLDLYCGVGLFSSLLEDRVESLTGVELNNHVAPYIDKNLSGSYRFFPLSLEKWITGPGRKSRGADHIIIDPPRTGLSKPVRKFLGTSNAKKIFYISCDPATMTRDLKDLLADNYVMTNFQLYDFYPQTSHMEAVALLERKG